MQNEKQRIVFHFAIQGFTGFHFLIFNGIDHVNDVMRSDDAD